MFYDIRYIQALKRGYMMAGRKRRYHDEFVTPYPTDLTTLSRFPISYACNLTGTGIETLRKRAAPYHQYLND